MKTINIKLRVTDPSYKVLEEAKVRAGTWRDAVLLAFVHSLELQALRAEGEQQPTAAAKLREGKRVLRQDFNIPAGLILNLLKEG